MTSFPIPATLDTAVDGCEASLLGIGSNRTSRLSPPRDQDDRTLLLPARFTRRFAKRIFLKLFCEDECVPSYLGFVDDVQLVREREFLIVQTGALEFAAVTTDRLMCMQLVETGSPGEESFRRSRMSTRKSVTSPKPSTRSISQEPGFAPGRRLVLTLGSRPGCSSAFQPVYWRVWQIANAELEAVAGRIEICQRRRLRAADSWFGYRNRRRRRILPGRHRLGISMECGSQLLPFKGNGQLKQTGARRFLRASATSSKNGMDATEQKLPLHWSKSGSRKLHRQDGAGDFPDPPLQCGQSELWQITTRLTRDPQKTSFLV